MAKSTKIGPQKLKVGAQQAAASKAKKARIAKETRAFMKDKQQKEDAQPVGVRLAKRPVTKNS